MFLFNDNCIKHIVVKVRATGKAANSEVKIAGSTPNGVYWELSPAPFGFDGQGRSVRIQLQSIRKHKDGCFYPFKASEGCPNLS